MPDLIVRRARWASSCLYATLGLALAVVLTRLPVIKSSFELSDQQVLMLALVVVGSGAVGSCLAGWISARCPSAPIVRVAMAGASVGLAAVAAAPQLPVLIGSLVLFGTCWGTADAASNVQAVLIQGRYGKSTMGAFHAAISGAAVAGALLGSAVIASGWSYALTGAVIGIVGLVANAAVGPWLLPERIETISSPTDMAQGTRHSLRTRFLLLCVPVFAAYFIDASAANWSGIYLVDGLGADISAAPLAFAAYQAALMLARLTGDFVVRLVGRVKVIRYGGIVAAAGMALIVAAPTTAAVLAGFALAGGGLAMVSALSYSAAGDVIGGARAIAGMTVTSYIGYITGTVAVGTVAVVFGPRMMFVIGLVLVPLIAFSATSFRPQRELATAGSVADHGEVS